MFKKFDTFRLARMFGEIFRFYLLQVKMNEYAYALLKVCFDHFGYLYPNGQNRQKSSVWECFFDNMALYFECRINKKRTPS